ncbi:MAG: hypothetical protein PQJ50_06385 [Spirochaetales bacterium]|nr:hypothetical protein [Spirochaetales bacterium]
MRRVIVLLMLSTRLYGYDLFETEKVMEDFVDFITIYNKEMYYVQEFETVSLIDRSHIFFEDSGYIRVEREEFPFYLIPGESIHTTFGINYYTGEKYRASYNEKFPYYYDFLANINIENISATSGYSETIRGKEVDYGISNLLKRFVADCNCHPFNFNTLAAPWVEGVDGYGIGERIDIDFINETDRVTVLNGYVDPSKTHLFKDNGRLKTVLVRSDSPAFEMTYSFDDLVYFADINFPEKTKSVSIEIVDVYEGRKYEDTCISAIVSEQQNVYPEGHHYFSDVWSKVKEYE